MPDGLISSGYMEVFQRLGHRLTKRGEVRFDLDVLMADKMQQQYAEQIKDSRRIHGQMKFYTIV